MGQGQKERHFSRQDGGTLQSNLIGRLLTQNEKMKHKVKDMAASMATKLNKISNNFAPVLDPQNATNFRKTSSSALPYKRKKLS